MFVSTLYVRFIVSNTTSNSQLPQVFIKSIGLYIFVYRTPFTQGKPGYICLYNVSSNYM